VFSVEGEASLTEADPYQYSEITLYLFLESTLSVCTCVFNLSSSFVISFVYVCVNLPVSHGITANTMPSFPTRAESWSGSALGPLAATHLCTYRGSGGSRCEPIRLDERLFPGLARQRRSQRNPRNWVRGPPGVGASAGGREGSARSHPRAESSTLMASARSKKVHKCSDAQSRRRLTACGSS
jgi:hypothetical protein